MDKLRGGISMSYLQIDTIKYGDKPWEVVSNTIATRKCLEF